jgi:hypothetical protein
MSHLVMNVTYFVLHLNTSYCIEKSGTDLMLRLSTVLFNGRTRIVVDHRDEQLGPKALAPTDRVRHTQVTEARCHNSYPEGNQAKERLQSTTNLLVKHYNV